MFKKMLLVTACSAALALSLFSNCGDSSTSAPSFSPSNWSGQTIIDKGTGIPADTFSVNSLSLLTTSTYKLYRTKVFHASGTTLYDTTIENGTYKVGATKDTLIPQTCSAYNPASGIVESAGCSDAQLTTHIISNTNANGTWPNVVFADWSNPDSISYTLKKQ